jgi:hypothetical protein
MGKHHGQYLPLSGRWIYIPAFENERLKKGNLKPADQSLAGPPFWSCTFTALMYGINFAFLGREGKTEVSHQEIVDLARASKDDNLRGGATTALMQAALKNHLNRTVEQEALRPNDIAKRLQAGKMVLAGIRAEDLTPHFRRFLGNPKALHRAAFVGFRMHGGHAQTRILDPMAIPSKKLANPRRYAGEWFPLHDYVQATFSNQQLWFEAGEFLKATPGKVKKAFAPARHLAIHPNATIDSYDADHPERPVLHATFGGDGSGTFFSELVTATVDDKQVDFLKIDRGKFEGQLIRLDDKGITADVSDQAQPLPAPPLDNDAPDEVVDAFNPDFVVPPGREAPPDRSSSLDNDVDDDPDDEAPPEEDALAIEDPEELVIGAGQHLAPVAN